MTTVLPPDAYAFHDICEQRFADLIGSGIAVMLDPPQSYGWSPSLDHAADLETPDVEREFALEAADLVEAIWDRYLSAAVRRCAVALEKLVARG